MAERLLPLAVGAFFLMDQTNLELPWDDAVREATQHRLAPYLLAHSSVSRWASVCSPQGLTLLHAAASAGDVDGVALLLAHGAAVNAAAMDGSTPIHGAAVLSDPRALELLVAAGADLRAVSFGRSVLGLACAHSPACTRVLVLNGAPMEMKLGRGYQDPYEPWIRALELSRLHCRAACLALLGIKSRTRTLTRLDRFVVREITFAVWATRGQESWVKEKRKCIVQ